MTENKKFSANWGGKRKGAGAKRTLPEGARPRSIKMTDRECEKVKDFLKKMREKMKTVDKIKRAIAISLFLIL